MADDSGSSRITPSVENRSESLSSLSYDSQPARTFAAQRNWQILLRNKSAAVHDARIDSVFSSREEERIILERIEARVRETSRRRNLMRQNREPHIRPSYVPFEPELTVASQLDATPDALAHDEIARSELVVTSQLDATPRTHSHTTVAPARSWSSTRSSTTPRYHSHTSRSPARTRSSWRPRSQYYCEPQLSTGHGGTASWRSSPTTSSPASWSR
jgi:hypothetical protein